MFDHWWAFIIYVSLVRWALEEVCELCWIEKCQSFWWISFYLYNYCCMNTATLLDFILCSVLVYWSINDVKNATITHQRKNHANWALDIEGMKNMSLSNKINRWIVYNPITIESFSKTNLVNVISYSLSRPSLV